jgi:L-histidine N-alpha-methyltransferase
LLLETDRVKDESTLVAPNDGADGIAADFNLNLLHRLNRELGADFDAAGFHDLARWNCLESRIEMNLEITPMQCVSIAAAHLDLQFEKRQPMQTENGYKFASESIRIPLEDAGFDSEQTWTDALR